MPRLADPNAKDSLVAAARAEFARKGLRGAQGTKFEGLIWELTDGEIARIQENVNRFKGAAACRTDVPSEIFASMIVGTYVLLGMRMSRMTEKPDLAEWARSLHTLIR